MRSLLWKEWHEQRWKLAFGSLILAAFALIGLRARVVADSLLLEWVCVLAVLLLPVLASTGLFPAERSDGTLPTLLALPVNPRVIFLVKTLMGILLCGGPLIVAGAVSVVAAGGREISATAMIDLYVRTLAVTLSLFFWMFALTLRLPSETRAGLIALGVLIGWMMATVPLMQISDIYEGPSIFLAPSPFVFLLGYQYQTYVWERQAWDLLIGIAVRVHAIIAALLLLFAARRLASEAEGRS